MKNTIGVCLLALFGVLSSAQSTVAEDLQKDSAKLVDQFKKELKLELLAAIDKEGLASAVSVCAVKAPLIASRLSRQHGVRLQRVSDRTRNPLNKPSEAQNDILQYFATNHYGSDSFFDASRGDVAVYAEAIRAEGLCLSCHGTNVSQDVKDRLDSAYPFDQALGYSAGELRGIFSVERAVSRERSDTIKHLTMMSDKLWVGGQPTAEQLATLKALGIDTVINLRTAEESSFDEATVVEEVGMQYVSFPIAGANDVSFKNSAQLRSILDQSKGPVFLHCASSNRVGALLAMDAYKGGLDRSDALLLGRQAGMRSLQPVVEAQIDVELDTKSANE